MGSMSSAGLGTSRMMSLSYVYNASVEKAIVATNSNVQHGCELMFFGCAICVANKVCFMAIPD